MDGAHVLESVDASEDNDRYLKALTACGDQRRLVVAQAIYSATGIKLLAPGARVDSRVLDRLFGHTLAEPIDRCVTTDDAVRHKDIVGRTRELVAALPMLVHFEASLGPQAGRLWTALGACPLPPTITLRLTVARDTAPILFEHSLTAAFIALFIGVAARFSHRELEMLATAALLHDAGMLHADPTQYAAGKPLDLAARRNLLAHPLTAQLIAQREPLLNPAIAEAVAQHHERLDGSGYPKGLAGEEIGKFARVLMLVEVVCAVLEHERQHPELRLSLILRLNHRSFDHAFAELLLGALPKPTFNSDERSACPALGEAVALLAAWRTVRDAASAGKTDRTFVFVDERLQRLQRWLVEAGVDTSAAGMAQDDAAETPLVCAEMQAIGREALWHTRQIAYAAIQRESDAGPEGPGVSSAAQDALSEWISRAICVAEPAAGRD